MANITPYQASRLLDWSLLVSTPTLPAAIYCGLATSAPTASTSYEMSTSAGYTRYAAVFAAASDGTILNSANIAFGPFFEEVTVAGIQLWDMATPATGNMLWFGSLSVARTLAVGSYLVIAPSALSITIS